MTAPGLVLVVEDDLEIRECLVDVLEEAGCRVVAVNNGFEALKKLRSGGLRPTLILLDLMMPVMDGLSFRQAQLADPALADIPAVLLSAQGSLTEPLTEFGFVAHLRKPINLDELLTLAGVNAAEST